MNTADTAMLGEDSQLPHPDVTLVVDDGDRSDETMPIPRLAPGDIDVDDTETGELRPLSGLLGAKFKQGHGGGVCRLLRLDESGVELSIHGARVAESGCGGAGGGKPTWMWIAGKTAVCWCSDVIRVAGKCERTASVVAPDSLVVLELACCDEDDVAGLRVVASYCDSERLTPSA